MEIGCWLFLLLIVVCGLMIKQCVLQSVCVLAWVCVSHTAVHVVSGWMPKVSMPRCVKRRQVKLPDTKFWTTSSGGLWVLLEYHYRRTFRISQARWKTARRTHQLSGGCRIVGGGSFLAIVKFTYVRYMLSFVRLSWIRQAPPQIKRIKLAGHLW